MGWHYDFYKIYKTKQEDVELWSGKSVDMLPNHLQFLYQVDGYAEHSLDKMISEIKEYLLPIKMMIDEEEYMGYLAILYPVVKATSEAFEVDYKSPRKGYYHYVKLTNHKAKQMIKFVINQKMLMGQNELLMADKNEYVLGSLGKKNKYKHYPGKLRNIVYFYYH